MMKISALFLVVIAATAIVGQFDDKNNEVSDFDFKTINIFPFKDIERTFSNTENKERLPSNMFIPKHQDIFPQFLKDLNTTELEEFLYIVLDVKSTKYDIESKLDKWAEKQTDNIKKGYNIFKAKEELRKYKFEKFHEFVSSKFFPDAKDIDNKIIALIQNKTITIVDEKLKIRELVKNAPCSAIRQLITIYPFVKSEVYRCIRRRQPLEMNIILEKMKKPLSPFGMSFRSLFKPIDSSFIDKVEDTKTDSLYAAKNELDKINGKIYENIEADKEIRLPTPLPNTNIVHSQTEILNTNEENSLFNGENNLNLYNKKQMPKDIFDVTNNKENILKLKSKNNLLEGFNGKKLYESSFQTEMMPPSESKILFRPDLEKPDKRIFEKTDFESDIMPLFSRRIPFRPDLEKPNRRRFLGPDFESDMISPFDRKMLFRPDIERAHKRIFLRPDFKPDVMPPFHRRIPFGPNSEIPYKRRFLRPDFKPDVMPLFHRILSFGPYLERLDKRISPRPDFEPDMIPPLDRGAPFDHDFKRYSKKRSPRSDFEYDMISSFGGRMPLALGSESFHKRRFLRPDFEPDMMPPFDRKISFGPDFKRHNIKRFQKSDFESNMILPSENRIPFGPDSKKPGERRFTKSDFELNITPSSDKEIFFRPDSEKPGLERDILSFHDKKHLFEPFFDKSLKGNFPKSNSKLEIQLLPEKKELIKSSTDEQKKRKFVQRPIEPKVTKASNEEEIVTSDFKLRTEKKLFNPEFEKENLPSRKFNKPFETSVEEQNTNQLSKFNFEPDTTMHRERIKPYTTDIKKKEMKISSYVNELEDIPYKRDIFQRVNGIVEVPLFYNQITPTKSKNDGANDVYIPIDKSFFINRRRYENERNFIYKKHPMFNHKYDNHANTDFKNEQKTSEITYRKPSYSNLEVMFDQLPLIREARLE